MPKRIVIVGAGGFGRGVYSWLAQSPRHRENADVHEVVFVDDFTPKIEPQSPPIGTLRDYVPNKHDQFVVAVGNPQLRRTIVEDLSAKEVVFHTFIDDRATVADTVRIGPGTVVCPGTVISAQAEIGPHVHINFNCSVGHDSILGQFTTLSPMTNIMGEVVVGSEVFFGGSAVVLPRITIGDRAVVGAGSTVVHAQKTGATVIGTPAKARLTRQDQDDAGAAQ